MSTPKRMSGQRQRCKHYHAEMLYKHTVMWKLVQAISQQGCRPFTDFLVPMVAVPLLVMFGLMLQNLMQGDWMSQSDTRWRVLGLAVALLIVSLLVCCYITSRLGLCICSYADDVLDDSLDRSFLRVGMSVNKPHVCEKPPSYESATVEIPPPPYSSVYVIDTSNIGTSLKHV